MMSPGDSEIDILIVGAGQAGLATAYALRESGRKVVLVDDQKKVGDSWRSRYDSLVLFTPRLYSALPGLPLEGDPDGFPTKDEIGDYLERYCQMYAFKVVTDCRVVDLTSYAGRFFATTENGELLRARSVVIATGAFQKPSIPPTESTRFRGVEQWTVDSYRKPQAFHGKRVLIVGDGASGRQIAAELIDGAIVTLATGKQRRVMPERIFGKNIFWWLEKLGLTSASTDSWIGQRIKKIDAFPGKHLELDELRCKGVAVRGRLVSLVGNDAFFADGYVSSFDAVIWATGYREDYSWISIPEVRGANGKIIADRGVSQVQGLYFIGRSWQTSRGSALLLGVGRDAKRVASAVEQYLKNAVQSSG